MFSTMTSAILGTAVAVVAGLLSATQVFAAAPVKVPLVNTPFEANGFCSFPVEVAFPVNNETMLTWSDSAGNPIRSHIEGHLVATLTNGLNPSKSVTVNISGPGEIVYNSDGTETITFLGSSGVFVLQGSQPVLLLTSGRVVVVAASPTSLGTIVTEVGRQANVCGLIG